MNNKSSKELYKENYGDFDFQPLGFEIIRTDPDEVEAVAAVFDRKTGLFRTKVLVFKRELEQ